jgi:hypothetical protein
MTAEGPSTLSIAMTWLAVAVSIGLIALGVAWYGFSLDVHQRFWSDIADRVHGPMTFRFYLQPAMALLAAIPDGVKDARLGHKSFFWTALWQRNAPAGRLKEGLSSIARVILLGLSMDLLYQFKALDQFYPAEAVMMAVLLAVVPYFIFRRITEIVARRWFANRTAP